MATIPNDTEKAFVPYTDDENAIPQATTRLPYWARLREKRSRWFSWKTALLVFVIIGLVVARAVEGPIRASFHKKASHSMPQATTQKHEVIGSPVADANDPAVSSPAETNIMDTLNEPGEEPLSSGVTIGVSIAASVDGVGNRQVYDLTSEGVLRIRKIQAGAYSWTPPEVIPVTEPPQKGSPLSAVSWRGDGQSIVTTLVYVNKNNVIVRILGTQDTPTSKTTNWKTTNVIYGDAVKAFGGLALLNIGPKHDKTKDAGQLRIIFVDQAGQIKHLNSLGDNFVWGSTGFKAAPGSDVSQAVKRDPVSGQVTDISTYYVDPTGGLKEIYTDEKNARNTYKAGRTVDPLFPITFPGHFAASYGGPPPINRVYTLNPDAPGERRAATGEAFTQSWWQTISNDKNYYPSKTGAPLAVVAWGDKEVRVVFKSKASDRKLTEVGLSDQGPGAGVKWFGRGFFN